MFITPDGWTWFKPPNGRSFWGQRHGVQRTGPTPDQPGYVSTLAPTRKRTEPVADATAVDTAARPPPISGDAPPDPFRGLIDALNDVAALPHAQDLGPDDSASAVQDRGEADPTHGSHGPTLDRIRSRLRTELLADSVT